MEQNYIVTYTEIIKYDYVIAAESEEDALIEFHRQAQNCEINFDHGDIVDTEATARMQPITDVNEVCATIMDAIMERHENVAIYDGTVSRKVLCVSKNGNSGMMVYYAAPIVDGYETQCEFLPTIYGTSRLAGDYELRRCNNGTEWILAPEHHQF